MDTDLVMRPVLVGYDGTEAGRAAVLFAAAEAMVMGHPLCVLHAQEALTSAGRGARPEEHIADALNIAALVLPIGDVWTDTTTHRPDTELLARSEGAELLVVGRGAAGGGAFGPVAEAAATRARCPVVVVPGIRAVGPWRGGTVVVGVDHVEDCEDALRAAFVEAELRGAHLLAVHATDGAGPAERQEGNRILVEALWPFCEKFPNVIVDECLLDAAAPHALLEASARAVLLVVGAHGRAPGGTTRLGSVARELARTAPCPVLVARPRTG